ncbi:GAF domain-containing protein [Nocardioides ginsengisegetis]|uniref:GAF domain-containing protein n=1 Tax=Nocardioides ginsengisegetis TaxID=661491 RepID=A0A7W3IYC3_9ACTN|nr:GAF and ANTAR domain-containing protein [Nocardioides ginsengisegetis]MBA8802892.1 GAF domain-containing protein [Nocardioides ginsengisegetis]
MPDRRMFLQALSDFAHALIAPYDVEVVLGELTGHVTAVLGLAGSGVSLVQDGQLHFANAVNPAAIDLEQAQHDHRTGPCLDAIRTGEVVAIADLTDLGERWPEYVAVARRHGVSSVAGIPLTLVDATVGALDLYSHEPREWSAEELLTARVFADMATAYLVNASKLDQQRQLTEQLQRALDQRVVIEQAKGITAHAHGTGVDTAFALIRRHARDHNASVRVVAEAIVHAGLRV